MQPSLGSDFLKREESTLQVREYYYFLFEGRRTEPDYFDCLKKKHMLLADIEYKKIEKIGLDKNNTLRKSLIETANDYKNYLITGKKSVSFLVKGLYNDFHKNFEELCSKPLNLLEKRDVLIKQLGKLTDPKPE